ncbi:SdrD B-like domain-containing protein, partial [Spirosoma aerophilum]
MNKTLQFNLPLPRQMMMYCWLLALLLMSQLTKGYVPHKESAPKLLGIGDFVFLDYNRNGIQDAGEPGIANVRLRLYQSGIERAQTTTDNNGQYTFAAGLVANTAYEVRIDPTDFPTGLKLTGYQQGSNREVDSDAQLIGGNAVIFLTTNSTNTQDNSYDIGFVAGNPDLIVTKTTNVSQTTLGSNATFTIQVNNSGSGAATNVIVRDTLDVGLAYVSSSPTATTAAYGATRILSWNIGTITAGASTSLTVTTTTRAEGVLYNTAYATTTDTESSTANNSARTCVTVPIKLCAGEEYVASLPAQYTNVQWFRNGGTTPVGSGNSFTIVQSGSYTFTTTANVSCPANGCCPIIVEDGLVPTLAITPTNPVICQGQSTNLSVSGCTGGTLLWSANTSSATTTSVLVAPTLTTVYSVTCTPTAYGTCPGVTSTTVTVNPSVTATLSSLTICNGTSGT